MKTGRSEGLSVNVRFNFFIGLDRSIDFIGYTRITLRFETADLTNNTHKNTLLF